METYISFKTKSELYGVTDCVINNIDRAIKTGFAPCGDGTDYKFSTYELEQLKRIKENPELGFFPLPEKKHILNILRQHPLVNLSHKPTKIFLVGSYAANNFRKDSDIDILLITRSKEDLTQAYRKKIADHFVKHNISVANHLHPNYEGKRIDLYFGTEADLQDDRPRIELK